MRDARYLRLISWTLQSGSEQFLQQHFKINFKVARFPNSYWFKVDMVAKFYWLKVRTVSKFLVVQTSYISKFLLV
jgi:hypothetical protein